jgi:uncharacterized Fe-S cluster protein YjdI
MCHTGTTEYGMLISFNMRFVSWISPNHVSKKRIFKKTPSGKLKHLMEKIIIIIIIIIHKL